MLTPSPKGTTQASDPYPPEYFTPERVRLIDKKLKRFLKIIDRDEKFEGWQGYLENYKDKHENEENKPTLDSLCGDLFYFSDRWNYARGQAVRWSWKIVKEELLKNKTWFHTW